MTKTRRIAAALALAAALTMSAHAQSTPGRPEVGGIYDEERHDIPLSDANWRIGLGIGPSIGTDAALISDFRLQERLYARRQFNEMLQAEVGVGIHRTAGNYQQSNEYDTHFWTFDARALFAPAVDEQWNPYGFAGLGYAIYRVIDPADETMTSEGDVAAPEEGGALAIPLGVGVQFKPARQSRIAVDVGLGYSMILDEELDGEVGGGNASTINGLVALEYLFHDTVEEGQGIVPVD